MTQVLLRRTAARELGLLLAAWCPAAAAGWGVHTFVTGPAGPLGADDAACWAVAVLVALAVGALLTWLLVKVSSSSLHGAALWAVLAAVGWGVANSAGWLLAVEVGGPTTGIVTGAVLAAASSATPSGRTRTPRVGRVVAVAGAGLAGVLAAWVLTGGAVAGWPGLLLPTAGGVLGLLAGRTALLPEMPVARPAVLVVVAGLTWVGAWVFADAILSPVSLGLSVAGEIVLAATVVGSTSGVLWAGCTAERVVGVAVRWAVAAAVGVAVGVVGAAALRVVLGGELVGYLGAGTTIGLGLAAWIALLPSLRRIAGSPRSVVA